MGCDPAPAPKDDSTLRLAYTLLRLSRGACRSPVGPWTPAAERRGPPRLFVDRSYVPCCAALLRRISVRSRSGQRKTRRGGFQRSELLPARERPAALSNRAEGTPLVRGLAFRDVATLGSVHSGDEGPLVSGAACAHHRLRSWGAVDPVLTRSAGGGGRN